MPLKFRKAMRYLREKYKVTDPDLVAIAKSFNKQLESQDEPSWDELVQPYLERRKQRGKVSRLVK